MLDFRRKSTAPNYLARPQQRRLLTLMLVSGLMIILISQAAKPATWRWMFLGAEQAGDQQKQELPQTRLKTPQLSPDMPDAFIAMKDDADEPASGEQTVPNAPPAGDAAPAEVADPGEKPSEAPAQEPIEADRNAVFPGVRTDYLRTVRDDAVLRGVEHDAWFHLFEVLERTDEAKLRAASTGKVGYVQLFEQPKEYRGRLVTVRGVVRGVRKLPAAKNIYGISEYYQLSLEPEGGPAFPIIIYALHLPTGFPEGMKVTAECSATGFFYKRWAYQAQDGIHTAPLILARTVEWRQPTSLARSATTDMNSTAWIVGATAAAAGLIATMLWLRSRRPSAVQTSLQRDANAAGLSETLRTAELTPSVEEALRGMSKR